MTTEQFAYWLQGYSEICGTNPTPEQWLIIQDHLKTVFTKVTPDRGHIDWNPSPTPYPYNPPQTDYPFTNPNQIIC